MCLGLAVPALAVMESQNNTEGVVFRTTLSQETVTKNGQDQTVTVTLSADREVEVDSIECTVFVPTSGCAVAQPTVTVGEGYTSWNAQTNSLMWFATTQGNASGEALVTAQVTIPAETDAGQYRLGFRYIVAGRDYTDVWETGAETYAYLTVEDPAGSKTLDVAVSNGSGGDAVAAVTAPEGGWTEGENTFTVSYDAACVVAVKGADGSYTRLTATPDGEGAYRFTADLTAGSEIVVVVKGDVDGDGEVSALDALAVLDLSSAPDSLTGLQMLAADLDGDGEVSAMEALQLLDAGSSQGTLNW
jgi:hypothetical protein